MSVAVGPHVLDGQFTPSAARENLQNLPAQVTLQQLVGTHLQRREKTPPPLGLPESLPEVICD